MRGLGWREARLEDVGEFVAWLQLPPAGRSGAGLTLLLYRLAVRLVARRSDMRGTTPPTVRFSGRAYAKWL